MRHFRSSPLAIAALACGVGEAAPARFLVTPTRFPLGLTAGGFCASLSTVDIAPVAVAANHYLAATTSAVEQTRAALHRLLLPMRAGLEPNPERYFRVGRAPHGLGARHRGDCGGQDRCRACLNGPIDLTDSPQPVTPLRPAAEHHNPLVFVPSADRCSPPSSVIRRTIHRLNAGLRNRRQRARSIALLICRSIPAIWDRSATVGSSMESALLRAARTRASTKPSDRMSATSFAATASSTADMGKHLPPKRPLGLRRYLSFQPSLRSAVRRFQDA